MFGYFAQKFAIHIISIANSNNIVWNEHIHNVSGMFSMKATQFD